MRLSLFPFDNASTDSYSLIIQFAETRSIFFFFSSIGFFFILFPNHCAPVRAFIIKFFNENDYSVIIYYCIGSAWRVCILAEIHFLQVIFSEIIYIRIYSYQMDYECSRYLFEWTYFMFSQTRVRSLDNALCYYVWDYERSSPNYNRNNVCYSYLLDSSFLAFG